jgi:hypothetical protein
MSQRRELEVGEPLRLAHADLGEDERCDAEDDAGEWADL